MLMTDKPNYSLKDLLNELKEKEKGCGKEFEYTNDYLPHYINCGNRFANTDIILCPTCQAEISALKKGISACEERDKEEIKFIEYLERQIIGSGEKIYTEWLKQELSIKKTKLKGNLGEIFL